MPALVVLGRKWHIATDDLPFPCFLGALYHGIWVLVISIALGKLDVSSPASSSNLQAYQRILLQPETAHHPLTAQSGASNNGPISCDDVRDQYLAFLHLVLWFFVALALVLLGLSWTSSHGSILEVHKRRWVPVLAHVTLLLYVAQAGIAVYGTTVVYSDKAHLCIRYTDVQWRDRVATLALLYSLWVGVAAWFIALLIFFNMFPVPAGEFPDHDVLLDAWERRCRCLSYFLCCWQYVQVKKRTSMGAYTMVAATPGAALEDSTPAVAAPNIASMPSSKPAVLEQHVIDIGSPAELPLGGASRTSFTKGSSPAMSRTSSQKLPAPVSLMNDDLNPLRKLARVFAHFFGNMDLTFSDIATALMLVGIEQRLKREDAASTVTSQQHNHQPVGFPRQLDVAPASPPAGGSTRQDGLPRVDLHTLEDTHHYFRFACGSYGWPMWVWANREARKWHRNCSLLTCCNGRRRTRSKGKTQLAIAEQHGSNSSGHLQAIVNWTKLPPDAVVYSSSEVQIAGELPFYIAVDEARNEVVLSVRGSMSLSDCVTDLLCHPVQLPPAFLQALQDAADEQDIDLAPVYVHGGILSCAQAILAALDNIKLLPTLLNPEVTSPAQPSKATEQPSSSLGSQSAASAESAVAVNAEPSVTAANLRRRSSRPDVSTSAAGDLPGTAVLAAGSVTGVTAVGSSSDVAAAAVAASTGSAGSSGSSSVKQRRLVIVGHSLGAAVATLLSLRLRPQYPSLVCWCYSPPGGLLSAHAGPLMSGWVRSVVIGRDMIPRLSTRAMQQLCHDMLDAAARCRVSKLGLWWRTGVRGHKWRRTELFREDAEVEEVVRTHVHRTKDAIARSPHASWLSNAEDFGLAGQVLYFEQVKETPHGLGLNPYRNPGAVAVSTVDITSQLSNAISRLPAGLRRERPPASLTNSANAAALMFAPRFAHAAEFQREGLLVSRSMFASHVPDFQIKVVKQAVKRARAALGLSPGQSTLHPGHNAV